MRRQKSKLNEGRIQGIHEGLDLGFSDYYSDQNVRDRTISNHLRAIENAVELVGIEEAVNFSLFQALGASHPAAEIYVLDFPSDLRAALYLLLGGYYRPALLSLRNWLEMRLLGVYFGRVEHDPSKYAQWKLGSCAAPFGRTLVRRLFALVEFRKADTETGLRHHLEDLYSELSEFTHGAGLEKHNLQRDTDNVPRYNRASVRLWLLFLSRTFAEVTFSLFVAYGTDTFRSLSDDEVLLALKHLPRFYRRGIGLSLRTRKKEIQERARSDAKTNPDDFNK